MVKKDFTEAVMIGREIEFTCNGKSYFESHKTNDKWYIECEKDQTIQYFESAEELLNNCLIDGIPLHEQWDNIKIQYILGKKAVEGTVPMTENK